MSNLDDLFGDENDSLVPQDDSQPAQTSFPPLAFSNFAPLLAEEQARADQSTTTLDQDLFGDDEDEAQAAQQQPVFDTLNAPNETVQMLSEEEVARRQALEYEEDFSQSQGAGYTQDYDMADQDAQRIAEQYWCNLPRPRSDKMAFWHVKLPNFLRVDPLPFDDLTWNPDYEDEQLGNVPDENVIRWRWQPVPDGPEGSKYKQSNARIVIWQDGTASLQIGSEFFDVATNIDETAYSSAAKDSANGAPAVPTLVSKAKSLQPNVIALPVVSSNRELPQGLTYAVADHSYGPSMWETHARITGTMAFTPTTIQSKAHRRLAANVSGKHQKEIKTKAFDVKVDPEKEMAEKEAAMAAKAKAARKEARKAKGGGGGGYRRRSMRSTRLDAYSDEDDEEGSGDGSGAEGGDGPPRPRSLARNRRSRYREWDDEDDEAGFVVKSDEEGEEGKVSRAPPQEDDEMDDLDAAAERAERSRKERKKGSISLGAPVEQDAEAEMDIDPPSPPAGSQPTEKRRLVIEGSDEE